MALEAKSKFEIKTLKSVFLPAREELGERKLVVVLHGMGDSVEGYRFLPEFIGRTDLNYLLLNAPDPYYTGFSWFEIPGNTAPGIIRSRELLNQTMDEILAAGFKSQNILFFGFSQGALLSMDFALRSPRLLAGAAAISGFVAFVEEYPKALGAEALRQKYFVSHGDHDGVIPLSYAKPQFERLTALGVPLLWKEYHKDHTIEPVIERKDLQQFFAACFGP